MAELLKWYQRAGSCADVVCSTRVRLARNLKHYPFPAYASVEQKEEIEQKVKDAMLSGNSILSREFRFVPLENLSEEAAVSFVERHLVSPEYISDRKGKGVLQSARLLSSQEFMELISYLRMGLAAGLLQGAAPQDLNALTMEVQPATLMAKAGETLDQRQRDSLRAKLAREACAHITVAKE